MKTLLEIKNDLSKERGHLEWSSLLRDWMHDDVLIDDLVDEVSKRYASQFIDAAAEEIESDLWVWENEAKILKLKEQLK